LATAALPRHDRLACRDNEEGDAALAFLNDHRARIVVTAVSQTLEARQLSGRQITEELGAGQTRGYVR
jgi:hypothetical protein